MQFRLSIRSMVCFVLVVGIGSAAIVWRDSWSIALGLSKSTENTVKDVPAPIQESKVLKLSEQARKNLGLTSKGAMPQSYWRSIHVPGVIADRPGRSDRGITSPAVGVVSEVHAFPGDTVKPGDRLFTLRLFSEYLQNTQAELFKATRETQLIAEQRTRLEGAARGGAVPEARLIELENQRSRQATAIQTYRQDLLTRGLAPEQIDAVTQGNFVSTIEVVAPPLAVPTVQMIGNKPTPLQTSSINGKPALTETPGDSIDQAIYEVQELKADLGQQVQAGQLLSVLSNHQSLYIEGHAFKQEATYLSEAASLRWPIHVEFAEDDIEHWPALDQVLEIHHLANSIDPASRTFDFFVPLINQSRNYEKEGHTFVVWRFRPGQRVRLQVPVEELKDVFVLPSGAIVREGPEAYVFQQNGDLFNRIPVHVVHEDRLQVVLANDSSITPGFYLAQNAAASLNRVLKAQAASGMRADIHVHADGTTHAAH